MRKSYLPIYYPDFIGHIGVAVLLLYRKRRRGYAYRRIKLDQGYYALVDSEDYDGLNKYNWYRMEKACKGKYYAARIEDRKIITMHRVIMNARAGMVVDHKDGEGLNNTKGNLRLATCSQNNCNRRGFSGRTSKYKGVSRDKRRTKWRATIYNKDKGRNDNLGFFKNEDDAARAYDEAARKYHGEFAWLNFDPGREDENRPIKTVFRSILGVIADVFRILAGGIAEKLASCGNLLFVISFMLIGACFMRQNQDRRARR